MGDRETVKVDEVVSAIREILDGNRPDLASADPRLAEALTEVADRLEGLAAELSEMSPSDDLTSLAKENVFNNVLWREFTRAQRYGEPMSLALFEVIGFEEFAGARGSAEGDRLLRHVASVILQIIRETDLAARYGEDRFAVIMPQTPYQGALEFVERVRKAVKAGQFDANGGDVEIRMAAGAAAVPTEGIKTAPDLVERAASALDEAKKRG